ncbi:MAG TPA: HU family DNA-binding protein [bacterium]|nr:HU family DNA-binding protein [bacterium]
MLKSDLIKTITEKGNLSKRDAENFVNLMFDIMANAMLREERIEIRGFGSFVVRHYGAYKGRNPRDGSSIKIGAKRLPHFKPGRDLLQRINEG